MWDNALNRLAAVGAGIGLVITLITLSAEAGKSVGVWFAPALAVGLLLLLGGIVLLIIDPAARLIRHIRPRPELSIRVTGIEWRNWREYALIAQLSVRITNNAPHRKQLVGTGLGITPPTHAPNNELIRRNTDVQALVESLRQQRQMLITHRWLEPGDSVSGWIIEAVGDPAAGSRASESACTTKSIANMRPSCPVEGE